MILSSFFVGANLKGWIFLYEIEIGLFNRLLLDYKNSYALLSFLVALTHLVIICLPLMTGSKYFKKILLFAPPFYVILFTTIAGVVFFLLLPFMFLWAIALYTSGYLNVPEE